MNGTYSMCPVLLEVHTVYKDISGRWVCGSVLEHVPRICEALGLILGTAYK